jgi:prepilin-type N-terminal cleavage/methylation domain-containing protein
MAQDPSVASLLQDDDKRGFTLIEMSIVLVIIGLIIGGILVGRDLIKAAEVTAQISQITKYNSAVNTFKNKYGGLPGDLNAVLAAQFGFAARGQYAGEGDGSGIIEGISANSTGDDYGTKGTAGETAVFWVDLSAANLIDGGFNTATETAVPGLDVTLTSTPAISAFLPAAKIGRGNYVYVWSGGWGLNGAGGIGGDGQNYFGLSAVTTLGTGNPLATGGLYSAPALTPQQAYNMDKKIDDGLPQSGSVTAQYVTRSLSVYASWAAGGGVAGASTASNGPTTAATAQTSTTCYDNGSGSGAMQYSIGTTAGNNLNCALSFRFQ